MSRIEYNPSLNDRVNGQLGDLGVEIQIPLSSIKELIVPPAPPAPVAPYKVYTALVSQSGSSEILGVNTGDLTIGISYQIIENGGTGWDFTNVGAPNNNIGTYFVATGITPNSWGTNEGGDFGTLQYNAGAPVVTVLQNTIGDIYFTYGDVGLYYISSNGLFTLNKTVSPNDTVRYYYPATDAFFNLRVAPEGTADIALSTITDEFILENDYLEAQLIEIRVYN
jgi:hypothetical protein